MDMAGQRRIHASRDHLWQVLNDPDVLRRCLPGCEELRRISDDEIVFQTVAKVGPTAARFHGRIVANRVNPPDSCSLLMHAEDGGVGTADGRTDLSLIPQGNDTLVAWRASATVGGRLASVGDRVLRNVAEKAADEFLSRIDRAANSNSLAAVPPAPALMVPDTGGAPISVAEAHDLPDREPSERDQVDYGNEAERDLAERTVASRPHDGATPLDLVEPGHAPATRYEMEFPQTASAPRPTNTLIFMGIAIWLAVLLLIFFRRLFT